VIVCAATQKPASDVVPSALRDLFGFRLALRCNTPQASDTILGQGWATLGHSAATIAPGERGIGLLLAEDGTPIRMRGYYLGDQELDQLAGRAAALLEAAGFPADVDETRGLDHGAWVPLLLMYPEADVPVTQLSLQAHLGPAHHFRIGEALRPLRETGVLVLGSGSLTHNLGEFRQHRGDPTPPPWVVEFADWMADKIARGSIEDLLDYRRRAPHAERNHPTDEHLLPLFFALGAARPGARGSRVHTSNAYGVLAMDAYAFDEPAREAA
jgi:hypothetical protein